MFKTILWLLASLVSAHLSAQTVLPAAPSAESMIEQLKKKPATRGFRNLEVEAAPQSAASPMANTSPAAIAGVASAAPAPAARPSLSLLIEFDYDSVQVRADSRKLLTLLAQALQSSALRESMFLVEGHTDAKGGASYNQKLSLQRAQSVRDFLASQGVQLARLQVEGKGSAELANRAQPLAPENRRVRIVNLD